MILLIIQCQEDLYQKSLFDLILKIKMRYSHMKRKY